MERFTNLCAILMQGPANLCVVPVLAYVLRKWALYIYIRYDISYIYIYFLSKSNVTCCWISVALAQAVSYVCWKLIWIWGRHQRWDRSSESQEKEGRGTFPGGSSQGGRPSAVGTLVCQGVSGGRYRARLGNAEQAQAYSRRSSFRKARGWALTQITSFLPRRSPRRRHPRRPTLCHREVPWLSALSSAQVHVQVSVDSTTPSARSLPLPSMSLSPSPEQAASPDGDLSTLTASGNNLSTPFPEPTRCPWHAPPWASFLQTHCFLLLIHHGGPARCPVRWPGHELSGLPSPPRPLSQSAPGNPTFIFKFLCQQIGCLTHHLHVLFQNWWRRRLPTHAGFWLQNGSSYNPSTQN